MTSATTIDWAAQQEAARRPSLAGGSKPALACMEQLTGTSGCASLLNATSVAG
ncbi:hypothetical protein OKW45_002509 [Paraburkholderia sp. WSM4175]|uniref:hypothetical protein n=1 Tax=Paraburkholderia sp. WSM4175 TaxID=2991072 RepID=UPI003D1BB0F9